MSQNSCSRKSLACPVWRYWGKFVRHPQRRQESKENRDMLLEIIRCTRYLARQGVALRDLSNNEDDGNFIQLLMLTWRRMTG